MVYVIQAGFREKQLSAQPSSDVAFVHNQRLVRLLPEFHLLQGQGIRLVLLFEAPVEHHCLWVIAPSHSHVSRPP